MKMILKFICMAVLVMNIYGCVFLVAGAAGGVGTSVWLSGKLTQEVNAPFERTIKAAESALKSLKLEVAKETTDKYTAQIMSKYTDGKTIWIDINRITDTSSKIDVRVGAVNPDKEAAAKILKKISRYL